MLTCSHVSTGYKCAVCTRGSHSSPSDRHTSIFFVRSVCVLFFTQVECWRLSLTIFVYQTVSWGQRKQKSFHDLCICKNHIIIRMHTYIYIRFIGHEWCMLEVGFFVLTFCC